MPIQPGFVPAFWPALNRARLQGALAVSWSALTFAAPQAHADTVVAFADGPVTVIRGFMLHRASEGTRLINGDIVDVDAGKSAQLEDGDGTLIALGPETKMLLSRSRTPREAGAKTSRVTMLRGWLKLSRMPQRSPLFLELPALSITPAGDASWSLIVNASEEHEAVFAESGNSALALTRICARASQVTLTPGQYAERASECLRVQTPPPAVFVDGMPVGFRDALVAVSGRSGNWRDLPPPVRPVDYADVSDWLTSNVSERSTFIKRFAPRLKTPAFRSEVDAHLSDLPEWRPVLHPPRPVTNPGARRQPALTQPRDQPAPGIQTRDKPTPDDGDSHTPAMTHDLP